MTATEELLSDLCRYRDLIAGTLRIARVPEPKSESPATVQVERGAALASAVLASAVTTSAVTASAVTGARQVEPRAVDRLVELSAAADQLPQVAVVDAAGHARPVYRPLLIYAWLASYRIAYEWLPQSVFGRWDEALRPWCDLLESELGQIALSDAGTPAIRGGSAAEAAWTALALHLAGRVFVRDAWTDLAADTFGRLARGQQPGGAFLLASASDNPEPLWYHELAILHAAASYAVQTEDRHVARAVAKSTKYICDEVQPDHATSQPWGVFAFIWNAATRPLAEQLLHAAALRQPDLDGVSLILLADALYCLRLFTDPEPTS